MTRLKKRLAWLALLTVCLALAGCRREPPATPEPSPLEPSATITPAADEPPAEESFPIILDHLTFEVVVDWDDTERILGNLEELSRLLETALATLDCTAEERVTITISTAGGITAQALGDGGVDAAFLPAKDLSKAKDSKTVKILESSDQTLAAAVTGLREDQRFCSVLAEALTTTEEGLEFVEICYPGTAFSPAEQTSPES